jgi:hypothetical protein
MGFMIEVFRECRHNDCFVSIIFIVLFQDLPLDVNFHLLAVQMVVVLASITATRIGGPILLNGRWRKRSEGGGRGRSNMQVHRSIFEIYESFQ